MTWSKLTWSKTPSRFLRRKLTSCDSSNTIKMALDTAPSDQVLDMLFDEDNGVLSKELDLNSKGGVETFSFVSFSNLQNGTNILRCDHVCFLELSV